MTNTPTTAAWTWGQTVATTGTGPTATVEIDVRVPGHREPEPVVVPLADARVLHAMLGDAIRELSPGGEAAVTGAATETPAQLLRRTAHHLCDLATRSNTVLDRHEVEWTDLTVSDKAYRVSPMVWSQYAAAMGPVVGLALADWLDHQSALLDENTHPGWQEVVAPHALAVARQILGEVTR